MDQDPPAVTSSRTEGSADLSPKLDEPRSAAAAWTFSLLFWMSTCYAYYAVFHVSVSFDGSDDDDPMNKIRKVQEYNASWSTQIDLILFYIKQGTMIGMVLLSSYMMYTMFFKKKIMHFSNRTKMRR